MASGVSIAVVMGAWLLPSYGGPNGEPRTAAQKSYQAAAKAAVDAQIATMLDQGTIWLPNGEHVHTDGASVKNGKVSFDPAEKNAIARAATDTGDPTTAAEAKINRAAAARQRNSAEPKLASKRILPKRLKVAQNRYAMANGCYAVRDTSSGRYLSYVGSNPRFQVKKRRYASPIFFKPTDLGTYLLWTKQSRMLSNQGDTLTTVPTPGAKAVWTITGSKTYRAATSTHTMNSLRFERTTGCKAFPEAAVNVSGPVKGGATRWQETRGYIDAHTHGMAYEFLGGMVHCGKPWDQYGVTVALRDCPDHEITGGKGAVMESFLSGDLDGHDPVGWPTFKDWPAPQSLTHEGTYYKWLERSWRGGQRVLVNLLVENNQLCQLYPLKKNSCDDMKSIELQAKNMRQLERYIDAQSGGPGKGWYRIVTNPDQARKVINAGKFAVIMGIETSVPFQCTQKLGVPASTCTKAKLDGWLDRVHKMGVSQMELVNKFDNALSGVAGDEGTTGILVNAANTLETLSPWRMRTCNPNDPEVHDKDQYSTPVAVPAEQQDALFGAVLKFSGVNLPSLPIYPPLHHCNAMGLTDLGEYTIRGLAKRNMLFDPDHMSVKARKAALDLVDQMRAAGQPIGVLSSHSWSTVDAYPRIYKEDGFITPYAGDSAGFVAKWKRHLNWANPKTYWGIGFGADINGLGAQGSPRANNKNPVTYPFKGFGGVTIHKQHAGKRIYDINKDGVAQYGLYPDWIEDLRKQAGSAIVKDMTRGPEAYLQLWERAYGIQPDSCTQGNRLSAKKILGIRRGTTSWNVLKKLGQPHRRLGKSYTYCSKGGVVKVYFAKNKVTRAKRV